jgi:hypothetical protein
VNDFSMKFLQHAASLPDEPFAAQEDDDSYQEYNPVPQFKFPGLHYLS